MLDLCHSVLYKPFPLLLNSLDPVQSNLSVSIALQLESRIHGLQALQHCINEQREEQCRQQLQAWYGLKLIWCYAGLGCYKTDHRHCSLFRHLNEINDSGICLSGSVAKSTKVTGDNVAVVTCQLTLRHQKGSGL